MSIDDIRTAIHDHATFDGRANGDVCPHCHQRLRPDIVYFDKPGSTAWYIARAIGLQGPMIVSAIQDYLAEQEWEHTRHAEAIASIVNDLYFQLMGDTNT